jgi:hypothetical protein
VVTNGCIVWEAKTPQLLLKGSEMHLSIALVLLPRVRVEEVDLNLLPIIQLYGNLHIQDERQQEIHKQRE